MTSSQIWEQCKGNLFIKPIQGTLFRLIESQEQVATRRIVSNLEDQALLENLLDEVKPPYPNKSDQLHYLLRTPFRYPPLAWGSRFGGTHEPSIFYGGCSLEVTLIEAAYYRFVFLRVMKDNPSNNAFVPNKPMHTEHTLFTANYQTNKGVQLQSPPFEAYVSELAHPTNYSYAQNIGLSMRREGVVAFEYASARSSEHLPCVGLFVPDAFVEQQPTTRQQWFCDMTSDEVIFKAMEFPNIYRFKLSDYCHLQQ